MTDESHNLSRYRHWALAILLGNAAWLTVSHLTEMEGLALTLISFIATLVGGFVIDELLNWRVSNGV